MLNKMSDLKHTNLDDLLVAKNICEKNILQLKSQLLGQKIRLGLINKYIFEKTTIKQIELRLRYKVILK